MFSFSLSHSLTYSNLTFLFRYFITCSMNDFLLTTSSWQCYLNSCPIYHGTPSSSSTQGVSLSAGRLRKVRTTQLWDKTASLRSDSAISDHSDVFYGAPSKYKASNSDLNRRSLIPAICSFFSFVALRIAHTWFTLYKT